jgi:tetrapyrrole methylase family protein/MazG family protein
MRKSSEIAMEISKLILASQSPRRKELLESAGFKFEVVPAKGAETIPENTSPCEVAMHLARQKAVEVSKLYSSSYPNCAVIGADTIVYCDGDFLEKPADKADAFSMLKRLSGRKHCVYTGVAVNDYCFYEKTEVTFHDLSDNEINDYIETGEPFDKAGAYGIQEKGMLLVKSIKGDFYNVMGLPISRLTRVLHGKEAKEDTQVKAEKRYDIHDLLDIMARLRVECPWDREQNHASIRTNVIEEAYEVAEAIDLDDAELLCEELGDLLLQVVFHAQIAKESDKYDFDKICDVICRKLIYRHPHVYKNTQVDTTGDVLKNWEQLKSHSKNHQTITARLNDVPKTLPALMRGEKVGKRAAHVGFDFYDTAETIKSLKSEVKELELALLHKNEAEIEEEFGDILLSCCNLGRFLKKDCEKVLTFSINKFIMRFGRLEEMALKSGKKVEELNRNQLEELWCSSKKGLFIQVTE